MLAAMPENQIITNYWHKNFNMILCAKTRKWIFKLFSSNQCRVKMFSKKRFDGNLTTKSSCELSNFHTTMCKNEKFGLTKKIFRQINSLVICLVKPLLSRNFCRKSVRLKFHNFHTVHTTQCGNYGNLLPRFFGKNFVKATHLLNK